MLCKEGPLKRKYGNIKYEHKFLGFLMQLCKLILWNCVLQVHLYISLPDDIFQVFLQKQNHSLVPLTFCTINHKRYDGTTFLRDILEKLCYREMRKKIKNTGILAFY